MPFWYNGTTKKKSSEVDLPALLYGSRIVRDPNFFMGKYSTLIFACLKTPYNKPFNWEFVTINLTAFLY